MDLHAVGVVLTDVLVALDGGIVSHFSVPEFRKPDWFFVDVFQLDVGARFLQNGPGRAENSVKNLV